MTEALVHRLLRYKKPIVQIQTMPLILISLEELAMVGLSLQGKTREV